MDIFENKYLFVGIIVSLILIAFVPFFISLERNLNSADYDGRINVTSGRIAKFPPPFFFMLSPILMLLIIPIAILYSNKLVEKKLAETTELLLKVINKNHGAGLKFKNSSVSRELVARLLNPKEMAVIEHLLNQPAGVAQAEVAKMPGMTKLRAHRIINKMKDRGIISVKKIGKTNIIKIDGRIKEILLSDRV